MFLYLPEDPRRAGRPTRQDRLWLRLHRRPRARRAATSTSPTSPTTASSSGGTRRQARRLAQARRPLQRPVLRHRRQPHRLRRREERTVVDRPRRQAAPSCSRTTRASCSTARTTCGCGRDGGIYFTDPFYKRDYWKRGPQAAGRASTSTSSPATARRRPASPTDLKQPNGIIGTPDGKTLYVADIGAKKTYAYDDRRRRHACRTRSSSASSAPTA